MTPEQFDRARTLFQRVAILDPGRHEAELLAACPDDPEVRREVLSLLVHRDADLPLNTTVVHLGDLEDGSQPHAEPEVVATYKIIRVLGEGGMGTVYEAEQASPRRRVALKVIRAGVASRQTLRRFEMEKEALGRLDHPNIARIFEAGMADAGSARRPYFAMELVDGVPLIRHAKQAELGIRERVELVARVCDGVHHAHQKGVVHRDLKPANILVNKEGLPKILDFGVARLADAEASGVTTADTQTGHILGTLQYMSPEQAAGEVRLIDTRSDVYALGLILYELLGGQRPYNLESKSLPDALRVIQEEEPTRLGSISRGLRGDLETIVAKAMEKERDRRYASAAELASDLRRFLNDEPISARLPGTWYNLKKFTRRNRTLVGGMAATFLVLVAGIVATSAALFRESHQRDIAEQNANRARTSEAATSRALAQVSAEAGVALEQRGRWEPAIAKYREALAAAHPDRLGLGLRIVRCLTNALRRNDAAVELKAVERDFANVLDTDPNLLFVRGEAISFSDSGRSRQLLEAALARGLTGPDADYARGLLSENVPAARACFEQVVEKDPFHHDANGLLSLMLLLEGRLAESEKRIDLWQQFFPESKTPNLIRIMHAMLGRDDATIARRIHEAEGLVQPGDLATFRRLASLIQATRQNTGDGSSFANLLRNATAVASPAMAPADAASFADLRKPRCLDALPSLTSVVFQLARGPRGMASLFEALAKTIPALRGAALTYTISAADLEQLKRAESIRDLETALTLPEVLMPNHEAARTLLIAAHSLAVTGDPKGPDAAAHRAAIARLTREQLAAGGFRDLGGNWPNLCSMVILPAEWDLTLQVADLSDKAVGLTPHAAMARGRAQYELGNYGQSILALDQAKRLNPTVFATTRDELRRQAVEKLGMLGVPDHALSLPDHDASMLAPAPATAPSLPRPATNPADPPRR